MAACSSNWTFRFVGEISRNFPNRIVYSAAPFMLNVSPQNLWLFHKTQCSEIENKITIYTY